MSKCFHFVSGAAEVSFISPRPRPGVTSGEAGGVVCGADSRLSLRHRAPPILLGSNQFYLLDFSPGTEATNFCLTWTLNVSICCFSFVFLSVL